MFALDTNTLIYFFKGLGRVKDHFFEALPSDMAIPSIVLYELEIGISQSNQPSERRVQLDMLLAVVTILPFDVAAAKRAAELSGLLRKLGTPIGPLDTLIAGIALANGATLVTHNLREFRRVRGLSLVDWF